MSPGATIAPQLQISASLEKPESLQVHGSDSRAIKALSFRIKNSMGAGSCQAKANEKQKSYVQDTGNRL